MSYRLLLLIIIVSFLIVAPVLAAPQCSWINSNMCPVQQPILSDKKLCNFGNAGICCCGEQKKLDSIPAKYIIIGSVIVVLGIITIFSFVFKKNEYEQ